MASNRIEQEISLLMAKAAAGELPGYPETGSGDSFYAQSPAGAGLVEYDSRENDALERQLKALWADDPEMLKCIPLVLAAVEKSRGQAAASVAHTELYNYTM